MSNGKRAPTRFKKMQCCSVTKTIDHCRLYELDWNIYVSNWAFWISRKKFFLQNRILSAVKIKMNQQVAHHGALSYSTEFSSSPSLFFNQFLAPILVVYISTTMAYPATTNYYQQVLSKEHRYDDDPIHAVHPADVKHERETAAVYSYQSSMGMIEKNAKY